MKKIIFHRIDKEMIGIILILLIIPFQLCRAQQSDSSSVSNGWVPDNGDGTYTNPIIYADYSDPDPVPIKVNGYFYMTSSSFNAVPGLPILRSKDLVNWTIIGHALDRLVPEKHYSKPQHGDGVWAPSFRYHNGTFYIYWGDPDFGIYMVKTDDPGGEWSDPVLVKKGKGLIDPSPLWTEDGSAYLVHAFAASRAGIKSLLVVHKMSPDGTHLIGDGVIVYNGHGVNPTIEGPKFYQRNGYYYILAPAGGVSDGWQLALRSKNVFGPYKVKTVLHQGDTNINGPHQGGLVFLDTGETWFIHFQEKLPYGRIVHLQPVHWENGWPVMGIDKNNDGNGEPVLTYKKPNVVGGPYPIKTPQTSDEFNAQKLGLQWQWAANPEVHWALFPAQSGHLRLYAAYVSDSVKNYWQVPHLLLQKFPAPSFVATTKFKFVPKEVGTKTGLIIMGHDYSYLSVTKTQDGLQLSQTIGKNAAQGNVPKTVDPRTVDTHKLWFRVRVEKGGMCYFSYSTDGKNFTSIGKPFQAKEGAWIGAKVGIFSSRPNKTRNAGYADFDWFRVTDE